MHAINFAPAGGCNPCPAHTSCARDPERAPPPEPEDEAEAGGPDRPGAQHNTCMLWRWSSIHGPVWRCCYISICTRPQTHHESLKIQNLLDRAHLLLPCLCLHAHIESWAIHVGHLVDLSNLSLPGSMGSPHACALCAHARNQDSSQLG